MTTFVHRLVILVFHHLYSLVLKALIVSIVVGPDLGTNRFVVPGGVAGFLDLLQSELVLELLRLLLGHGLVLSVGGRNAFGS